MRPVRSITPSVAPPITPGWVRPRHWLRRYAPAEVAAVLGAVGGASAAALWSPGGGAGASGAGAGVGAVAGSVGEALAFYGFMLVRELRSARGPDRWRRRLGRAVRDLVLEFGPAELVDTLAVRPLAMYLAEVALASTIGGVLVGKVAADLVFYGVAIACLELRRSLSTQDAPVGRDGPGQWSRPAPRDRGRGGAVG